jgi:hypothetical protein
MQNYTNEQRHKMEMIIIVLKGYRLKYNKENELVNNVDSIVYN